MFQHFKQVVHVAAVGVAVSLSGLVMAAPVSGQGTWESTLQARDINHDGIVDAYYDTSLKVSWLADAFADGPPPGFPPGRPILYWSDAQEWVHGLNVHGVTGWRLPTVINDPLATDPPGARYCPSGSYDGSVHTLCGYNSDPSRSELVHMYYVTLGNKGARGTDGSFQPDAGLSNTGPFSRLTPTTYWTGVRGDPSRFVWTFMMSDGAQGLSDPVGGGFRSGVWAVHDGDIATAVPEPAAVALTLGGLFALVPVWRKRRPTQA